MKEKSKPNIIWIFGDQHRAQALGCHGDSNVNTPNIDLLAGHGLDFTDAVCGMPLCCPFRGSLLTGLYPHQCVPGHEYQLNPEQPTIADVFNENDYHTAYFGKWHLDGFHEAEGRAAYHVVPAERRGGFQEWLGYENNNSQWDCLVHGSGSADELPHRLAGYETDKLTDHLIDYLHKRKRDDVPFFAVLSVQPPHDPYMAPPEYMQLHHPAAINLRMNVPSVSRVTAAARKDLAGYYAQIENLDYNLGRVQKVLDETDLIEQTRIIFFSDHGDMHGSHGQFRKTTPYEESIRIPFIIGSQGRYYHHKYSGQNNALVNHVDIAPTTLGLCEISPPDWMKGTDFSGLANGVREPAHWPDSVYIQSVIPTGHADSVDKPWRGIITGDGWKYVSFPEAVWLLFNLNEDPYEQVNLVHNPRFRAKRNQLNDRLRQWILVTDDSFDLPE